MPSQPRRHRRPPSRTLPLAPLLAPAMAFAGPWEIGPTVPGDARTLETEIAWQHTATEDAWTRPTIKFAAPLGEGLAFEVGAGYGRVHHAGGIRRGGATDITAKLEWGLLAETAERPALMLEPEFSFDTGDAAAGIGAGLTTLRTPLRAGRQFGAWRLTGEVSYTRGFQRGHEHLIGYGGLVEYAANDRWTLGVDLVNDRPVHDGGRYHLRGEAGFKWQAADGIEVQALVGRSVENRRDGMMATLARFAVAWEF